MAKMVNRRPWDACEEQLTRLLRDEGKSLPEIARCMGRSVCSVVGKLRSMRLALPLKMAVRYLAELSRPHSVREVARKHGVTYQTVANAKWRLRRKGFTLWDCHAGERRSRLQGLETDCA